MALSAEALTHLCQLAKLAPDESVRGLFAEQCGDILEYMDKLSEVDTSGVEPLYSPVFHEVAMRDDRASRRQTPETILANAPETDGSYFLVPRIVEGK